MMKAFRQIMQNPWITLTALVATVLGLLYAIWNNYKQRKYPTRISYYSYRTINLT